MEFRDIAPIDRTIAPIEPVVRHPSNPPAEEPGSETGFGQLLQQQLDEVISLQKEAEQLQLALATGEIEDVNRVVLAMQKADLALNFAIEIRNKVIQAYQEISRMQI